MELKRITPPGSSPAPAAGDDSASEPAPSSAAPPAGGGMSAIGSAGAPASSSHGGGGSPQGGGGAASESAPRMSSIGGGNSPAEASALPMTKPRATSPMAKLAGLPVVLQRRLAVIMPAIGIVCGLISVIPAYRSYTADQVALTKARNDVLQKEISLAQLQNRPVGATIARLPSTREEPVDFLRALNELASSCGVHIVSYAAVAAAVGPGGANSIAGPSGGGAPATEPGGAALPDGTMATTQTISAEGTYASMAMFFAKLETNTRLLSVAQVTMNGKDYPVLSTNFQLTRYTGPPDEIVTMPSSSPTPGQAAPTAAAAVTAAAAAPPTATTSAAAANAVSKSGGKPGPIEGMLAVPGRASAAVAQMNAASEREGTLPSNMMPASPPGANR